MSEACLKKVVCGHKKREAREARKEPMLKSHGQFFDDTLANTFTIARIYPLTSYTYLSPSKLAFFTPTRSL